MKNYRTIVLLVAYLALVSCSNDDDPTPEPIVEPDPRLEYVGSYEINTVDITYRQGTVSSSLDLTNSSIIELSLDQSLNTNQMTIEAEDFLEETLTGYYEYFGSEIFINVTIDDAQIVTIEENTFVIRNLDFEMAVLFDGSTPNQYWVCETKIEGTISEGIMSISYFIEGHVNDINGTFEGSASGQIIN
ncbi:MAG: hypothetical protein ABJH05_15975 [Fulvivirga sp.]